MNNDLILAILIVNYLKEYSLLEKQMKELFKKRVDYVKDNKEELYFFYGLQKMNKNFQFDFQKKKLTIGEIKWNKELSKFDYSLNQILNLIEQYDVVKNFPNSIDSIQSKVSYQTKELFKKIGQVRNVLAHETGYIKLNSAKYEVESISLENLKKHLNDILDDSQIENMSDDEKVIANNLVYIRVLDKIISNL